MKNYLLLLSFAGAVLIALTGYVKKIALYNENISSETVVTSPWNFQPGNTFYKARLASEEKTFQVDEAYRNELLQNISNLPLAFEKNMGQWKKEILYRASTQTAKVGFRKNGLSFYSFREVEETHDEDDAEEEDGSEEDELYEKMVWNLNFKGMHTTSELTAVEEAPGAINYLLGNDSSKWIIHTPECKMLKYLNVYPNIDLHYYGQAHHTLKYDYMVKPGGTISSIQMELDGAGNLEVNEQGELIITTPWGKVAEDKPYSYQLINGEKKEVDIRYEILDDHTFGFKAYETFNPDYELVIDPKQLVWTSFVNGVNPTQYVQDIGVDANRNSYITGWTDGGMEITAGVVQGSFGGDEDAWVVKFNRFGTKLLYGTYIGGSAQERAYAIAVSASGIAYSTGRTDSGNYPTSNALYAAPRGSTDIFISALNVTGTGFIYSTYFGGGSSDIGRGAYVNGANELFVTGAGKSSSTPFPTTAGVYLTDAAADGSNDAFVVKLSSTGTNVFCTLLGGTGNDEGRGIFVSPTNEIYVTGITAGGFPIVAGYDNSFNGSNDAFVAKLNATATTLVYSTYLGGSGSDIGEGIYVRNNEAYVAGTAGAGFPTTAGAFQTAHGGGTHDVFVTKLNTSGNALVYSTFLGGSGIESQANDYRGSDVMVNSYGQAYVSGITASPDFPVINGYDMTYSSGDDGFISVVATDGKSLLCSTYMGGEANDYKRLGISLDVAGSEDTVYATITSHSRSTFDGGQFPIAQTQGTVHSKTHLNGTDDEPVVWKMVGCRLVPLPVEFFNVRAIALNDQYIVQWSTASETKNDYFSIEKSSDGIHFEVVGTRNGAGTSSTLHHYSYTDATANHDITYYRIRQTDTDGGSSYSAVVSINNPEKGKALDLFISGPVADRLSFSVCCLQKGEGSAEIIDMSGKVVMSIKVQSMVGYNKFTMNTEALPEGVYILKFSSGDGEVKEKFLK